MKFVDVMDETRLIEPVAPAGKNNTKCRVFFCDNLGVPRYCGTAPVPTRLIGSDDPNNRYVGFVAQGDLA